jgi:hypothetical protein
VLLLVAAVFSVRGWLFLGLVLVVGLCLGLGVVVVVNVVSTTFGVECFSV